MQFKNTANSYGVFARTLHWLTALTVLIAFPLGLLANSQDLTTDDGIGRAFLLFSLHKTTGVLALTLGIIRFLGVFIQARPAPVHAHRRLENFVAATVHWMLTIALIVVPLSGWLSHSATSELAPILWPFGQSLPFVPRDAALAETFSAIHWLFTKVLLAAVGLHIIGALKHILIDKDEVFARMWRGSESGPQDQIAQTKPMLTSVLVWVIAFTAALSLSFEQSSTAQTEAVEWPFAETKLQVTDGDQKILATTTAFGIQLAINLNSSSDTKGTLDLIIPLDALEGPDVDEIFARMPFPLLQFFGDVSGSPPNLTASGPLETGGATTDAEFVVLIDAVGARVTGTNALPALPELFLSIDARALRP